MTTVFFPVFPAAVFQNCLDLFLDPVGQSYGVDVVKDEHRIHLGGIEQRSRLFILLHVCDFALRNSGHQQPHADIPMPGARRDDLRNAGVV